MRHELVNGTYRCGRYHRFQVNDPKPRIIHKASVRDRLLHHAIYRILYPLYDKTFIYDSYSCRIDKGTHRAFGRLTQFARKASRNYTASCWALKCDIRKFFDSIDHQTLKQQLANKISDEKLSWLLRVVIDSFSTQFGKGIPLGNLTSQLFANIYLDPLDKFVKHKLKHTCYLRYADDFILLSNDKDELLDKLTLIQKFLKKQLLLDLHPHKIHSRKLEWGIDFVGYVALPHYCLPRRKTTDRIVDKIKSQANNHQRRYECLVSYLGYLKHSASRKKQSLVRELHLWEDEDNI